MAGAIKSVDGAKLITSPSQGSGSQGVTIAVVELSGSATLGKVVSAVEGAKTPHAASAAPGVEFATTLTLKPGTTPEQISDALKKAGLIAQ